MITFYKPDPQIIIILIQTNSQIFKKTKIFIYNYDKRGYSKII